MIEFSKKPRIPLQRDSIQDNYNNAILPLMAEQSKQALDWLNSIPKSPYLELDQKLERIQKPAFQRLISSPDMRRLEDAAVEIAEFKHMQRVAEGERMVYDGRRVANKQLEEKQCHTCADPIQGYNHFFVDLQTTDELSLTEQQLHMIANHPETKVAQLATTIIFDFKTQLKAFDDYLG